MQLIIAVFACLPLGADPISPAPRQMKGREVLVAPPSSVSPPFRAAGTNEMVPAAPTPTAKAVVPADFSADRAADRPATPEVPGHLQPAAVDLVAEALSLPAGSTVTGQPLTLLSVLSTVQDRRQQSEAVHAYWRLTAAVAEYRICLDRENQLGKLASRPDEAADLRAARAVAAAALREAEAEVVTAQHELAAGVMLPPQSPLPLPADRPHVGAYRTLFAELFAAQPALDRARLLDRTLPLRQRAVEAHTTAVQSTEDALAAAMSGQTSGDGRLAKTLGRLNDHFRQRQALMAAVCRYNHDIADYALAVAAPEAGAEALAGMLIKQNRTTVPPAGAGEASGTVPASYQQPLAPPPDAPIVPGKNWPTRAVRPGAKPSDKQ
jgi:hypothetical protein